MILKAVEAIRRARTTEYSMTLNGVNGKMRSLFIENYYYFTMSKQLVCASQSTISSLFSSSTACYKLTIGKKAVFVGVVQFQHLHAKLSLKILKMENKLVYNAV